MDTETQTTPEDEPALARGDARLVFLADVEDLAQPSSSHSLAGLDEVRFCRGSRNVERAGRVLTLTVPDPRMSLDHARLLRQDARWVLDDPSSKNGTLVDGVLIRRGTLTASTVLELGRTFWWFCDSPATAPHLRSDLGLDALPRWPAAFTTFSPALALVFAQLARLAALPISILLLGETGSGKELVARALHELSGRSGELVAVNAGALPQTLIESELFGHRKGAFSGATADRRGLVRSADGGTLFLDEIGELPLASQPAFLRVLQEHVVVPVGDDRPIAVDLRVISATLRDLTDAVEAKRFRADLYARIAGHVVELPPLRERREDMGHLIASLCARISVGRPARFSPPAFRALLRHDWPRNIRELQQTLTAALGLADGERVEVAHLPAALRERPSGARLTPVILDAEDQELRARLIALFDQHDGNVVAVSDALGKQRQQIYKWVKRLGIDLSAFRRS